MADDVEGGAQWVPFADSVQGLAIEGGTLRHTRPNGIDIARGMQHIHEGLWRIEYRVNRAAQGGYGIILGVADVEAAAWSQKPAPPEGDEGKKDAKGGKKDKKAKGAVTEAPPKFKPVKPAVAWGLCPSSGRLVSTFDPRMGRFGGASVSDALVERRCGHSVAGMTVVIECDIPARRSPVEALVARRDFRAGLHPLDAPREYPPHLRSMSVRSVDQLSGHPAVSRQPSLSFSVDGGGLTTTAVRLPEAGVYPYCMLTAQDDEVALVSVTKLSGDED